MPNKSQTRWMTFFLLLPLAPASILAEESEGDEPFGFLSSAEKVYQAQVFMQPNGALAMVWVQAGPYDLDLFVASQTSAGAFSHPTRINHTPVHPYTGDEARPAVAFGPDGSMAIAWTSARGDIMLATGTTDGLAFGTPLTLNQNGNESYRAMPAITYTPGGTVHAIWIDGREAPEGMEEPADLYYARVEDGLVEERNLTAKQKTSICGCCRPFIRTNDENGLEIAFRNTTTDGYRDMFLMHSDASGHFSDPQPSSPPIWKIQGCPMSGPIRYDEGTLWRDGSTDTWRLLWATKAEQDPENLFADRGDIDLTLPPRSVSGADRWILVGSAPHSFIVTREGAQWKIVREGLPKWVSSAAFKDGDLILLGNVQGRLRTEILTIASE